jgi:RimJ/RimL family protein N-acetyltransferase
MTLGGVDLWLEEAPPEELDAGRVGLRRWRIADAELLVRLVANNMEHLRPWMPWAEARPTVESQRAFLSRTQQAWEERTGFGYAVTLPDGEPIGGMRLHTHEGAGTMEIGYWIAATQVRQGYATEGSARLTEAALALAGVLRVEIRCDEANQASAAVPRKLGYKLVGTVDKDPHAAAETGRDLIWAVRRDDWRSSPLPALSSKRGRY